MKGWSDQNHRYCARIASKQVGAEHPYIVFSHTHGLLGGALNLAEANDIREAEIRKNRERGQELNAFVFQWVHDRWVLCGDLYELETRPRVEGAYAFRA